MKNTIAKVLVILFIPLLAGIGIGYAIRPSTAAQPVSETVEDFPGLQPANYERTESPSSVQDPISNSRQNAITRAVASV
ncbi:MAG TPA: hypothetical protein VII11_07715, partial [Bacteroidota bacterium]